VYARVHISGGGIGGDLGIADRHRARSDASRERVVEADRRRRAEDVDGLLQTLMRPRERSEVETERVGEDLVAEAHRQERAA